MKIIYFITLCISLNAYASESNLSPFTTDGCSAFPDGTPSNKHLWLSCCTTHDLAYWQGGTLQQRLAADKKLKTCVTNKGKPKIASLMYIGVRIGGSAFLPTPFRWGYGWEYPRGYKILSTEEIKKIQANQSK